jgi:hypothetical protein
LALTLACGLLLAGCSLFGDEDPTFGTDGVKATIQDDAIVVENQRRQPIWIRLLGTSLLPTISTRPLTLEGDSIPVGGQRMVDFENITMGEDEDEVSVSWWEATTEDGKRVAGEASAFRVEL